MKRYLTGMVITQGLLAILLLVALVYWPVANSIWFNGGALNA